jgi:hypothetical protein
MSRDGFTRMDVDTRWAYHRKARRLQRLYPTDWPTYMAAFWALLGEAWIAMSRDLTLDDAWVPAIPCTLEEAQAALTAAGFLDPDGRVPDRSWDDWFGPAYERTTKRKLSAKAAADVRWGNAPDADALPTHRDTDADALPTDAVPHHPRQPTNRPATPTRSSSQAPTAVPARANGAAGRTMSGDEYERFQRAWAEFPDEPWGPFKEAWVGRGLFLPPAGSPDDKPDSSQRAILFKIAESRPTDIARWVREAPGKTPRAIIDHVLRQWDALKGTDA